MVEHILFGFLVEGTGVGCVILRNNGVKPSAVLVDLCTSDRLGAAAKALAEARPCGDMAVLHKIEATEPCDGAVALTARAAGVMTQARAEHLDHPAFTGTGSLLVALAGVEDGHAAQVLRTHGITPDRREHLRRVIRELLSPPTERK